MGFGTSPMGTSPFGFGEPTEAPAPVAPDVRARQLDPATRDYAIDATTSGFARMTATRQRVLLALLTLRESSTVQRDWGVRKPSKMGASFEAEADQAVRSALRQLVEVERIIVVESVTTDRGTGGRGRANVHWRDLTTGETSTDPVIVG